MVKKAVFPIETLVLSAVLAAVVNQLVAFVVFAIYVASSGVTCRLDSARRSGSRCFRSS